MYVAWCIDKFFSAVVIIVFIPFYFDMQLDGSSTCDQKVNKLNLKVSGSIIQRYEYLCPGLWRTCYFMNLL